MDIVASDNLLGWYMKIEKGSFKKNKRTRRQSSSFDTFTYILSFATLYIYIISQ